MPTNLAPWMRDKFDELMDLIGIWIVYGRSDHRFRCHRCADPDTLDSGPGCGDCFGTGFKTTLERWKAYMSSGLGRQRPAEVHALGIGYSPEMKMFIFSKQHQIPTVGDRFFQVEWNQPRDLVVSRNAQPTRLVHVYRVEFHETNVAAEVIYNTAHCEFQDEALRTYEHQLLGTPITISRF